MTEDLPEELNLDPAALAEAAEAAERLRSDTAFQSATRIMHRRATESLAHEKEKVIQALLAGEAGNIAAVRKALAELTAVNDLMSEIATAIRRAPRKPKSVV